MGPENKRCADCGAQGTVWSSVNLGVFTCMRCGSFHRALGTHISKPKGCTGTYLWSPDEVQRMRDIGNARANNLYGSSQAIKSLPSSNATHIQWLEFFRDKYERRRWAEATEAHCSSKHIPQLPNQKEVADDLLGLYQDQNINQAINESQDFFAQFDL